MTLIKVVYKIIAVVSGSLLADTQNVKAWCLMKKNAFENIDEECEA